MRCAYCGIEQSDWPFARFAQCWDCYIRDDYKLPLLPWWKVAP